MTATEDASRIRPKGPQHERYVQGGILGDAVGSFFAALGTTTPNTTLSQNNGVLALTRCASRSAGFACAFWLLMFGVIAKIGAWIVSLPDCVLGGALAFLFCTVAVSGVRLMTLERMDRRTRFILSMALTIGLGTALVPAWSAPGLGAAKANVNQLWPVKPGMSVGLESFRTGVMIAFNTPYCVGTIFAIFLHLVIPMDLPDEEDLSVEKEWARLDAEVREGGATFGQSAEYVSSRLLPLMITKIRRCSPCSSSMALLFHQATPSC